MDYKTATYKEKKEFEKTLSISQRAKMRRMEKAQKEQIDPMNWASHAREQEVRREAWVTLKVSERVQELESATAPTLQSLREQIEKLEEQFEQVRKELYEAISNIKSEPYNVVYDDPQVKAMNAILHKTREAQEAKFQQLINSFLEKVTA